MLPWCWPVAGVAQGQEERQLAGPEPAQAMLTGPFAAPDPRAAAKFILSCASLPAAPGFGEERFSSACAPSSLSLLKQPG